MEKWFNWITECVTTASFSILVNRIPGEYFRPEREIRQGDHISPYIFIICSEYLRRYKHYKATIPKTGIGIKTTKNGPLVRYPMFADDCIIIL